MMEKAIKKLGMTVLTCAFFSVPAAMAGVEHMEFDIVVDDYADCTDEIVHWDGSVIATIQSKETPSGKTLYFEHWRFEAEVTGLSTGYVWDASGMSHYQEHSGITETGGWMLVENAIMKAVTPGAPRVKLDVLIKMAYNANGDLVVDRNIYEYNCIGQ